jgi:hypothetical protein
MNFYRRLKAASRRKARCSKWQVGKLAHGPLRDRCPRATPQPVVSIVIRSMTVLHGPIATSKEVRLFSTDALRYQP